MKTLKITEESHRDLSLIIYQEYKKTGIKMTYSEMITQLTILYHRNMKQNNNEK